ncbi:MAG TPA: class II aldolase/adducin family protein [Stellaceae bacterium]
MTVAVAFQAPPPPLVQEPPPPLGELDERQTRVYLAACYRLVSHFGMTDLVYSHISAPVPGEPGHFLINPYGMSFDEITASSLVKIDYDGELVEPSPYPVNKTGFLAHSAIHKARPDVGCVLHTHTRAGIAVSCMEEGLLPLNQHALLLYGWLAYHDYEGIVLDTTEQERLVADLGDKRALILRNHGLLTVGRTIPEAFEVMYYLDKACGVQLDLLATGRPLRMPPREVAEKTVSRYDDGGFAGTVRSWPALLRMLDAKDPSYRD